jgi:hypothetical protein
MQLIQMHRPLLSGVQGVGLALYRFNQGHILCIRAHDEAQAAPLYDPMSLIASLDHAITPPWRVLKTEAKIFSTTGV